VRGALRPPALPRPRPRPAWRVSSLAAWLTVPALLLLGGCAGLPGGGAAAETVQVASGVYLVRGSGGEPSPANLGRTGNAGFIVGPAGVLAIDSGTSYRHGKALLAAIRRVTDLPVRALLLTHTKQEFLFGAAAFREQGIPVEMHARAAALMAARCANCLKTLQTVLGTDEMQGTAVIKPDRVFDEAWTPPVIGRPVRVLGWGHSSGPGDVVVLDESTGTLFAGGLLDNGYVPDVQDSRLPGWTAALAALRQLAPRTIVPGHGATAGPELIDSVERYLQHLQSGARRLLGTGAALSEVPDALRLPDYAGWSMYDTIHRRNASIVFLRLEQEQLLKEGSPP